VITRIFPLFTLLLVLASCDEKQSDMAPEFGGEPGKRTTRADRPSRDVLSGRDKLRAAFESAKAREPGADRDQAIAEVAKKALESAPDMAAEIIRELSPSTAEKHALVEAYIQKLLEEEKSDEALAWADSLGDARDIASAKGLIMLMLAQEHPEQAAVLLPASDFTATGASPAAEQVLQTWVAKSPLDAVAWATRLPAGEARAAGYKVVLSQWLNSDSQTALSWVGSQANPQVRREVVGTVIGNMLELPDPIRSFLLEPASPALRAEIEQGIAEATRQTEVAEPTPEPEQETPSEPLTEPQSQPAPNSSPDQEIESEPAPESEFEPAEKAVESE
jgi:hypothetical protein